MEDLECKRQRIADRITDRDVFMCLSSLIGDLQKFEQGEYYDELQESYDCVDHEEALVAWIDDADLQQLEDLVEVNGYWADLIDKLKHDGHIAQVNLRSDEDADDKWYLGDSFMEALDSGHVYDDEDEAEQGALEEAIDNVRSAVKEHVWELGNTDRVDLCNQFDIDLDDYRMEVYEYWAVSNWLARRLEAHGYKVIEAYNMNIWCRTTTGQSISLDGVIRSIAAQTWEGEWNGREDTV